MNKLHIHECICTSCSERVSKFVRWCLQHLSNVHTCTCMVLTTPVWNANHTLRKNYICARACAHMQLCRNFFAMEAIANLSWVLREHRAGCRLPPALAAPPAFSTNPVAWRCSLKKVVQIHASSWRGRRCRVAQASFETHPWRMHMVNLVCATWLIHICDMTSPPPPPPRFRPLSAVEEMPMCFLFQLYLALHPFSSQHHQVLIISSSISSSFCADGTHVIYVWSDVT